MWDEDAAGVMPLPSGRLIRGRGLRTALPAGPQPEFGIYLTGRDPGPFDWPSRWVRWPDFWLPLDRTQFAAALEEALHRADGERVEIACGGGYGRTGTALACAVVLDGIPNVDAVRYVRDHYSHRAIETPWQRRFVARWR